MIALSVMCTISFQIIECVPGSHKGYIKPEGKAMDQACLRQLEDKGNIQPAVQCENKYLIDHKVAFSNKKCIAQIHTGEVTLLKYILTLT